MANPNYRLHYYTGDSFITDFSNYQAGDIIYEANLGTIVVYEGSAPDPIGDTQEIYSRYGVGTKAVTPTYEEERLTKITIDHVGNSSIDIDFSYFLTSKDEYKNDGVWANIYLSIANQISAQLQNALPAGGASGEIIVTTGSAGSVANSGISISNTTVDIINDTANNTKVPTVGAVASALESLNNKFSTTLASVLTFKGIVGAYSDLTTIQGNNTAVDNTKAKNGDVYRVTEAGSAIIYKTWDNSTGWTEEETVKFGPNTEFFWHAATDTTVQNPKGFWDILGTDSTDMTGKYDEVKATDLGSDYVIPLLVKDGDSTAIVAKMGTANIILNTATDEAINAIPLPSVNLVKSMITESENKINTKLVWSTWPTT